MAMLLHITDGTTTLDFDDTVGNYPLAQNGYVPRIPVLRNDELGGRGPYPDVVDTITFSVVDTTAAACYSRLQALNTLLMNAQRLERGENVTAVEIRHSPHGAGVSSTTDPLHARIIGPAGDDHYLSLPAVYDPVAYNFRIDNVTVSFVRTGEWLADDEDSDASTATVNGDQVTTVSLAAAMSDPSPTRFTTTNFGYGRDANTRFRGGYVIVSEAPADVVIINAEALATGTQYTSVADAGANARNTNILRYTPTSLAEVFSGTSSVTLPAATNLLAVFANIRMSATVSFAVRMRIDSNGLYDQFTPILAIPSVANIYPRWYFLGFVPIVDGDVFVAPYFGITASSIASFLDIDTLILCDARSVHIVGLPGVPESERTTVQDLYTLDVNHNRLTLPQPSALANQRPIQHDELIFYTKAQALYPLLLATGGGSAALGNEWRQASAADAVQSNIWTVYRRRAFLVPQ